MNPRLVLPRLRSLAGENKLFTWALAVGALLRVITMLGYPGALWFAGDSYVYVGSALHPYPDASKQTGYGLFLRLLLPFHSFTLVTGVQHLMGLGTGVMLYALLRRNRVPKKWAAIAAIPQLLDGYIIEDEHLVMAETVFTFLLMLAMLILLWKPRPRWWAALVAGLLIGAAAMVRTEGLCMLVVVPVYLLLRGWSWKTLQGWGLAIVVSVGTLVPVGAYVDWFHQHTGHYDISYSEGFYLWGRVSSFADCAVIKPTGADVAICPTTPIADRTPPGNYIWHAPFVHATKANPNFSPVTPQSNTLLEHFAIKAILDQPLGYAKTVVKDVLLSFGFPRIGYPGSGTTYYYNFHAHYVGTAAATGKPISLLPPTTESWTPWVSPAVAASAQHLTGSLVAYSAYDEWLAYGHQAPGVVHQVFAVPIEVYQRVVFTYGPLLAIIFLVGLGGLFEVTGRREGKGVKSFLSVRTLRSLRLHWRPRGTSMLPWLSAVALLVAPIAVADFDYRYLIPVIPFASLAAGLAFAPRRAAPAAPAAAEATTETTVPDQVA